MAAFLAGSRAYAERLPIEAFTVAQGLPSNIIHKIVRDSRGFLWFCTGDGLSRFDGHQFVNFGVAQGLPGRDVLDFIEGHSGEYWVATNEGLARIPAIGGWRPEIFRPAEEA